MLDNHINTMSSKRDVHDWICQDYYEGYPCYSLTTEQCVRSDTGGLLDKLTVAPATRCSCHAAR
eukprot:3386130-Amphidinium_carterae.1